MARLVRSPWVAVAVAVAVLAGATALALIGTLDDQAVPLGALTFLVVAAVAVATLSLSKHSRWGGPFRLLLLSVAIFVGGVLLHNVISGLLGIEEAAFFLAALWVAPGVFVAAIVRMIHRPHDRSQPTGMDLSPR